MAPKAAPGADWMLQAGVLQLTLCTCTQERPDISHVAEVSTKYRRLII